MYKKLIWGALLVALLVLGAAPFATASPARVNALGGGGDIIEDEANILRWSGSLSDYPDLVFFDSGSFNIPDGYWQYSARKVGGPSLGLVRGLGTQRRLGTVALYWHDIDSDTDNFVDPDRLRENLRLLYGRKLGPVDATLGYGRGSWKVDEGDRVVDHHADTFGLGLRTDLSDKAYLDLALDLRRTSNAAPDDPAAPEASDEEDIISARARAFVGISDRNILVPFLEAAREYRTHPFSAEDDPQRADHGLWRLGLALNHLQGTDQLLILAVEFEDGRLEVPTLRQEWTALILRAGFESRLSAWLTTRGSVGFTHYDLERSQPGPMDPFEWLNQDDPVLRVNLGAAVHLGPVDLDLSFGERYPRRGFLGQTVEPQKHWLSASLRWLY